MKIVLDLSDLVARGALTRAEADRLKTLAARDTGALGINVVAGFGIVAVAAGAGALVPSAVSGLVLGAALAALGFAILLLRVTLWTLLARICIVVGVLAFSGGLIALDEGSLRAMIAAVAILATTGIGAQSGLLVAAAVLLLGACLGSGTDYAHALYVINVDQPTLTIIVFALIALAAYLVSLRLAAAFERLALIASRTGVFLVNLGFWVGSLGGDDLARWRGLPDTVPFSLETAAGDAVIPAAAFAIAWALALAGAGLWAVRSNRRWLVNVVAVFAAIHFYTQWFERLGATPLSVLISGLLLIGFAVGLWMFNAGATAPA